MADRETNLMLAVKRGSRDAFEELYRLFSRPLANFLYRLCWDAQAVDDLVQEVFLRVWRAAPRWEPRAKVSTWIFRIAHNLWIKQASKRREQALGDAPVPARPEESSGRSEMREAVRRAVDSLPAGEREVLILAEYNGFRYPEIAQILDIPVGTVKSRMFHALRRLREALKDRPR
ncbi:MAG: RNA polymerase sigma factor [Planctomycetota bacterium]|jgi:RNA polymerase sigma-70 factor (ECF subfamily)